MRMSKYPYFQFASTIQLTSHGFDSVEKQFYTFRFSFD